jgi:hypothetical protein
MAAHSNSRAARMNVGLLATQSPCFSFSDKGAGLVKPTLFSYLQCSAPGANPTIASYNANVVKFYNTAGSLAHFENKNIIFYLLLKTLLPTTTMAL